MFSQFNSKQKRIETEDFICKCFTKIDSTNHFRKQKKFLAGLIKYKIIKNQI